MNKRESKNWSVILLMAIGVLFVTIAGCIFVSNTWKMMTDEAKEMCLLAVTIGIFIGSFILRKKEAFKITGKALYYLGVAASAFTSYMILGNFDNEIEEFAEVKFFKFAIASLIMLAEIAYTYISNKNIVDLICSYILANITLLVFSTCFSLEFSVIIILFAIEAVLLSINYFIISRNKNSEDRYKTTSLVFYVLTYGIVLKTFFLNSIVSLFFDDEYNYSSLIAILLLASSFITLYGNKLIFNKLIATLTSFISLCTISIDIKAHLDIIPDYYEAEFSTFFVIMFIVMINIIWYDKNKKSDFISIVTFIIACMTGLRLLAHNVQTEELACVLTLGLISVIVLFWSIYTNNKKYQILSGIILGLMAIYLTRSFWLSIAWWVYLLLVGIICITVAIIKEKNIFNEKQFNNNFKAEVINIDVTNDSIQENTSDSANNDEDNIDFLD